MTMPFRVLVRDDVSVATESELIGLVDRAFAKTGEGLALWPDPHEQRSPEDDEYSRVTDAAKWRIVGVRADAWLAVLEAAKLAVVERDASVRWVAEPGTRMSRLDRAVPRRPGALPLVVARSRVGDIDDAGVTFGVNDPAVCVARLPDCGCDACDSGSQNEVDLVDRIVLGVVSGTFRRLARGDRHITELDADGWSASGSFGRHEVDAILANPRGWKAISGASWLNDA